ncbi:MAG: PEGA domain-containing protein [Sandaracinaceae bacterium]|jgi:hypothetical protein|nr:PEGA domain-containing protein [Sandaracinaceae bacterium]
MLRSRVWGVVVGGLCLSLLLPSITEAQRRRRRQGRDAEQTTTAPAAPPNAAAVASARAAYGEGQSLFRENRFAEAQARFEAAYSAVPNPVVLLSIAETQERQDNLVASVVTLERYLRERADAPDREAVQLRITQMRARPARVHVMTSPAGATVWVDGQSTGRVSPTDLELTAGDHTVAALLSRHETARQSLTTTFGSRQEVHLTLNPTPTRGGVTPVLNPDGTDVLDGMEATPPLNPDGTEPVAELPPVTEEPEGGGSTATWVFAGVGAAALVTGTVLGFLAMSAQSDFDAMPTTATADKGERFALFADVAFVTAGVCAVTALVFLATSGSDDEADAAPETTARVRLQVAPVVGRNEGGLTARLTF